MGRGDRPASSGETLRSQVDERHRYDVVLAAEAEDELTGLVAHIQRDSPKNAIAAYEAVSKRLHQLGANPRTGHADPNAPLVPRETGAFTTTVKGISVYYLFPLRVRRRHVVYVISVRRGSRMPLEDPEYLRRWMEELARLAAPAEGSQG